MLTLRQIQENKAGVIERLRIKNFDATALVDEIIGLDQRRKAQQAEADAAGRDECAFEGHRPIV